MPDSSPSARPSPETVGDLLPTLEAAVHEKTAGLGPDVRFTIGQAARQIGCSQVQIRYWDEQGLLPPPRTAERGSQRRFYLADLRSLAVILRLRELKYSIPEIRARLGHPQLRPLLDTTAEQAPPTRGRTTEAVGFQTASDSVLIFCLGRLCQSLVATLRGTADLREVGPARLIVQLGHDPDLPPWLPDRATLRARPLSSEERDRLLALDQCVWCHINRDGDLSLGQGTGDQGEPSEAGWELFGFAAEDVVYEGAWSSRGAYSVWLAQPADAPEPVAPAPEAELRQIDLSLALLLRLAREVAVAWLAPQDTGDPPDDPVDRRVAPLLNCIATLNAPTWTFAALLRPDLPEPNMGLSPRFPTPPVQTLSLRAQSRYSPHRLGSVVPVGAFIAGRVYSIYQSLIFSDTRSIAFEGRAVEATLSAAALPTDNGGQMNGVLYLASQQINAFPSPYPQVLELVSDLVGEFIAQEVARQATTEALARLLTDPQPLERFSGAKGRLAFRESLARIVQGVYDARGVATPHRFRCLVLRLAGLDQVASRDLGVARFLVQETTALLRTLVDKALAGANDGWLRTPPTDLPLYWAEGDRFYLLLDPYTPTEDDWVSALTDEDFARLVVNTLFQAYRRQRGQALLAQDEALSSLVRQVTLWARCIETPHADIIEAARQPGETAEDVTKSAITAVVSDLLERLDRETDALRFANESRRRGEVRQAIDIYRDVVSASVGACAVLDVQTTLRYARSLLAAARLEMLRRPRAAAPPTLDARLAADLDQATALFLQAAVAAEQARSRLAGHDEALRRARRYAVTGVSGVIETYLLRGGVARALALLSEPLPSDFPADLKNEGGYWLDDLAQDPYLLYRHGELLWLQAATPAPPSAVLDLWNRALRLALDGLELLPPSMRTHGDEANLAALLAYRLGDAYERLTPPHRDGAVARYVRVLQLEPTARHPLYRLARYRLTRLLQES